MTDADHLYLIDGHALAYRAYFAFTRGGDPARWMTTSGEPTAGTYGFTSVILRLLEQESPEYLAVSFDVGKTFRDEIFPDYKGTREKMPDDLRLQIERIREVVTAFGIPILEADGYEADDVLGTVAKRVGANGVEVIILTGDRDLLQLVDDQVVIRLAGLKLSEAIDYGPKQVREKYQLEPSQLVDLKAMVGDKSDNIPGVKGIGAKTGAALLNHFGSLDAIPHDAAAWAGVRVRGGVRVAERLELLRVLRQHQGVEQLADLVAQHERAIEEAARRVQEMIR